MISLPYWAIVTPAQVFEAALESFGRKEFAAAADDLHGGAVLVCRSVTQTIQAALNRKLIVHPTHQYFADDEWCDDPKYYGRDDYVKRSAFASQWPIVEITGIDGTDANTLEVEILGQSGDQFLVSDEIFEERIERIEYFAGYRRADQTVSGADTTGAVLDCGSGSGETTCDDLAYHSGLESLTVLPPLLPDDIARVALRLAIFEMRVELRGLPGFDRTTKNIQGVTLEVERPDKEFVNRELQRITPFHRKPPSAR